MITQLVKNYSNNNYITVTYVTSSGRDGNGASEFSFVGNITNQDGAAIDANNISLVTTDEKYTRWWWNWVYFFN